MAKHWRAIHVEPPRMAFKLDHWTCTNLDAPGSTAGSYCGTHHRTKEAAERHAAKLNRGGIDG